MPVPVVLDKAASKPTAVLLEAVLFCKEFVPIAVFAAPVTFIKRLSKPIDVLFDPVVLFNKVL